MCIRDSLIAVLHNLSPTHHFRNKLLYFTCMVLVCDKIDLDADKIIDQYQDGVSGNTENAA